MTESAYTPAYTQAGIPCPVCGASIDVRPSRGRRSGKPFVMFICPINGRHFRGFITDQGYVRRVLDRLGGGGER